MLSWVEHEKSFITLGPGSTKFTYSNILYEYDSLEFKSLCIMKQ